MAYCHVIITSFPMLYWLKDTELVVRPATIICMVLFGMQCFVSCHSLGMAELNV